MARKPTGIKLDIRSLSRPALGRSAIGSAQLHRLADRIKHIIRQVEEQRSEGLHAYRELPYDRLTRLAIEQFAGRLRPRTDNLIILGIGGSALGNIALQQALAPAHYNLLSRRRRNGPRLFVLDNIDPVTFSGLLNVIRGEMSRTVINVISKSGSTAETAAQFMVLYKLLKRKLGAEAARKQFVVITDKHTGGLRQVAEEDGLASFPVPQAVGGRFSVLSAVGLFSAAMCGLDVRRLLKGAADMDQRVRVTTLRRNPAALFAAINYLCYRRGQIMSVMMPYADGLSGLSDWFRQLWAESLGKLKPNRSGGPQYIGPTPIRALGVTDQHSQIQLYREGPNDKLITFIELQQAATDVNIPAQWRGNDSFRYLGGKTLGELLSAEKRATEQALIRSGRPCMTLKVPRLDAYHVGQFIYMMQTATTIAGKLFGVDPYNQPGVELGKRITYHLMGRTGFERMPGK